jgi:hypothetical protein
MKTEWLDHIDAIIQSHCIGGVFCYSEKERNDAAVKALNSTATALTDIAAYLGMLATDLPFIRSGEARSTKNLKT